MSSHSSPARSLPLPIRRDARRWVVFSGDGQSPRQNETKRDLFTFLYELTLRNNLSVYVKQDVNKQGKDKSRKVRVLIPNSLEFNRLLCSECERNERLTLLFLLSRLSWQLMSKKIVNLRFTLANALEIIRKNISVNWEREAWFDGFIDQERIRRWNRRVNLSETLWTVSIRAILFQLKGERKEMELRRRKRKKFEGCTSVWIAVDKERVCPS